MRTGYVRRSWTVNFRAIWVRCRLYGKLTLSYTRGLLLHMSQVSWFVCLPTRASVYDCSHVWHEGESCRSGQTDRDVVPDADHSLLEWRAYWRHLANTINDPIRLSVVVLLLLFRCCRFRRCRRLYWSWSWSLSLKYCQSVSYRPACSPP